MSQGTTTIAKLRDLLARMVCNSTNPAGEHHHDAADSPTWSAALIAQMDWWQLERVIVELYGLGDLRAETINAALDIHSGAGNMNRSSTSLVFTRAAGPGKTSDGKSAAAQWFGIFTHRNVRRALFTPAIPRDQVIPGFTDGQQLVDLILALPPERSKGLLAIATEGEWDTPTCPNCYLKTMKFKGGAHYFWGCKNFPKCPQSFELT